MLVGSESLGQVKTESEECVLALSGVACAAAMMEFAAIELWIAISSVPTLFEQIQLISQICRNFVLDGSRKQLIQRDSLEHRQAQDL